MKREIEIKLTALEIAEAFCDLNDEDQAQVFIHIGELASKWDAGHQSMQWMKVGDHLRTCECSTWQARQVVRMIAEATGDT